MNNKIKKFALQAGFVWKTPVPHFTNTSNPIDFPARVNYEFEVFAQLIAAHCAELCMETAAKCAGLPGDGGAAVECAQQIKQDFGVE